MTTSQQSALASREKIQGYVKQMWREFNLFELSGIGLVVLSTVALASWKSNSSPELTVVSGIGALGCFAMSLIKFERMVEIQQLRAKEKAGLPRNGGSIQAIIDPLRTRLASDEKKALENKSKMVLPLLGPGQPDLGSITIIEEIEEPLADSNSADSSLQIANERKTAIQFITETLLNPDVIGSDPLSCVTRAKLLQKLEKILAAPPTSIGLSLTKRELEFLTRVINLGSITEKAPETMRAYLALLGELIKSYIFNNRVEPSGRSMADNLLSQSVQAEIRTGILVSPPIEVWKEAQKLITEERERVIITEDQAIYLAKSAVALGNSRILEVRDAFSKIFPEVQEILKNEKKRLEQSRKTDKTINLAVINTILSILGLTIDKLVDSKTISALNQLFGSRLLNKVEITPRDIIDEFEKTELGSLSVAEDKITVTAINTSLVDVLACAAVICYPHVSHIEICIGKNKWGVVDQSTLIPTGVFYSQRLILGDRQFISKQLREESAPVETISASQVPALLADVSV